MKKIVVTGASGQLGKCLQDAAQEYSNFEFDFVSKEQLDISNRAEVVAYFSENEFDYCINTAAYTNVDKAESEKELAFKINAEAVGYLTEACRENNVVLLHISTDYVFDGKKKTPYVETDETNPINVYGASKLKGEQIIQQELEKYYIIRTSWLYSQYGHNFYNSIRKFAKEGRDLKITTEQTGTPTNANDLAKVLLTIIASEKNEYGVYHFSNKGETTWYGFAKEILTQTGEIEKIKLEKTDHYPTFAARPECSVLDCEKVNDLFIELKPWCESLKDCTSSSKI